MAPTRTSKRSTLVSGGLLLAALAGAGVVACDAASSPPARPDAASEPSDAAPSREAGVSDEPVPSSAVAPPADAAPSEDASPPMPADPDITGSVDLRTLGALPPVKNQGGCEASGIFAITDAMSAAWLAASTHLASFSEQKILDSCGNGW